MNTYPQAERDRATLVTQKVAAEADAYIARLHLKDMIEALRIESDYERRRALARVELAVQTYLDSGKEGAAVERGVNSEGSAGGCGEAAPAGPSSGGAG